MTLVLGLQQSQRAAEEVRVSGIVVVMVDHQYLVGLVPMVVIYSRKPQTPQARVV